MRAILVLFLGGLCTVVGIPAALAQDSAPPTGKFGRPFRAKIGGYYLSEGSVKSNGGTSMLSFGLSYDMLSTKTTLPLIAGVYISDTGKSRNRTFGNVQLGTETTITGIGVQARTYFIPDSTSFDFFAGGGVGLYAVKIKTGVPKGASFVTEDKESTRLGGKVFAGIEWKKRFFGELEYTFPGAVQIQGNDFLLNGMNVSLGCRF